MATALSIDPQPAILIHKRNRGKSPVHRLALVFVWLAVASSFLVFSEPAPFDALTIGLLVLLPVIGLFDAKPGIAGAFALLIGRRDGDHRRLRSGARLR